MPIEVEDTSIPDVKIIRATRFYDARGFFTETYKDFEFLGVMIPKFVQDNLSESAKGVIRGLHWQCAPFSQGKLVSCLNGSILDVAVDVRSDSETYGQHVAVELNSNEQTALWVPGGFAHGFQALEDKTRVHYKVTNYWNKTCERSIHPLDPTLQIGWPIDKISLSEKDATAPKFAELY